MKWTKDQRKGFKDRSPIFFLFTLHIGQEESWYCWGLKIHSWPQPLWESPQCSVKSQNSGFLIKNHFSHYWIPKKLIFGGFVASNEFFGFPYLFGLLLMVFGVILLIILSFGLELFLGKTRLKNILKSTITWSVTPLKIISLEAKKGMEFKKNSLGPPKT